MLFANSETKTYLKGVFSDASQTALNTEIGVDFSSEIVRDRQDKTIFLVAGRLIYRKGHMFLLDALERLPDEVDYECRIVGTGPQYRKIHERCIRSKKLSKHVVLIGAVNYSKMREEYDRANVLVMPSIRETTGSVLLEAMSNGLPVITMDKFGAALILDESMGWLYNGVSKNDYINNLADALLNAITHPQEVLQRGSRAREQSQAFVWKKKIMQYQVLYRSVVENKTEHT